ncbi:hypothetical protein F2P81_024238 [Scophthalmus maximus]|uniref:Uncharacterized protein n=1 Tax=Scophthalmus maximus TaxID=52904 RepID=A0A6A4RU97_SCOMX|nr:hypothetical protein F2P81_024238 [Scophthalmus maximus]
MKYNKLNSATTDFTGICELASIALFAHSDYGICMKVFWSKSVISEQCKYYSSPTDCAEIIVSALNNRGRHVGKLTWRRKKNDIQNNKLVKGRLRCQRCVLIIKKSCSWPWLSTGMDFSDDVFVSAAEVEDNNEVIENLSNLACDKSSGGDLMDPKERSVLILWLRVIELDVQGRPDRGNTADEKPRCPGGLEVLETH